MLKQWVRSCQDKYSRNDGGEKKKYTGNNTEWTQASAEENIRMVDGRDVVWPKISCRLSSRHLYKFKKVT